MSALWDVEVLRLEGRDVRLLVRVIHPDSGDFPETKEFALRLLYDESFEYGPALTRVPLGPLGAALSVEEVNDRGFLARNVGRFVLSVAVVERRNAPLDLEETRRLIDEELSARGLRPEDGRAWKSAWEDEWKEFWSRTERLPSATYDITVTDADWLAHLSASRKWESAAF
jgi:hypothetical protein